MGFSSYGASLSLFVVGLRHLGTARTSAYFSAAPFAGAALSIALLGEPLTAQCVIAGLLMLLGVALHLTERHAHTHHHDMLEHGHAHTHGTDDAHHDHTHSHAHFPDTHHQLSFMVFILYLSPAFLAAFFQQRISRRRPPTA